MKKLITFFSICTTVAILALPAAARTSITQPDLAVQDQCTQEVKDALYASFLKNRQNDQAKAYEDAKKYLACPAGEVTEAQQKIIDYLKKWSTAYEKGIRHINLIQFLYKDMKYPEAYALGKEILADEPENLKVLVHLGANGYLLAPLNNAALTAESNGYAKKALALLEGGQTVDDYAPLAGRDVAVAYLNYTIGTQALQTDPGTALKHLLKAAQFDTPLKKSAYTFAYIAGAYETGPYAKQSQQYKDMYSGKDETPESKLALANINQLVDRMIDGYARAVALAGSDAKLATVKQGWNDMLVQWYKFRNNNSDTGLNELLAGILSKPLPPEPTPLTSLPAAPATPAATPVGNTGTPATNGGTAPSTTPATTTGTKPATTPATTGTKPANTPATTPATGTKPAPKPDRPRR